jgi:hypothetical protein
MNRTHCSFLLVLSTAMLCAQAQNPANLPPNTTPPTFPQTERVDPDHTVQSSETLTTPEVEKLVQKGLRSDPALANSKIVARATDASIVMSGKVSDENQHRTALLIAKSCAGEREIIDRITVGGNE